MRRTVFIATGVLLLLAAAFSVSAQSMRTDRWTARDPYLSLYNQKIEQILGQNSKVPLSSLTVGDVTHLLDTLSIARQQYRYVKRTEALSYALPGLGQYVAGDPGAGTLFLGSSVLLFAGTVVGAYYLLPSDLQFQSINYFTDSFSNIETAWHNHSLVQYLPSAAVLLGGAILQHILRSVSAHHAARLAEQNVRDGKVTFKPEPYLVLPGGAFPGVGIGMRMRY